MDNLQNNNVENNNIDNDNFKDKVNHKFSKVKENVSKSNSERKNFEERTRISNLINEMCIRDRARYYHNNPLR